MSKLPLEIDPIKFAESGIELEGQLDLEKMPRLKALLYQSEGSANVYLQFQKDNEGIANIQGRVTLKVRLICQRCSEAVEYPLNVQISLAPVISERQVQALPSYYEPLITQGNPVILSDVIEDEIILNLPMVPKHPEKQCPIELPDYLH